MKAKILLNTLCISLLLYSLAAAQKIDQKVSDKVFSIPFEPSQWHALSFSFDIGEPSRFIPAAIDMRSSGLFVNNFTDRTWPGVAFRCDLSQTCKPQGSLKDNQDYSWIIDEWEGRRPLSLSGPFVKEKVNIGSVTLPNADVLIANFPGSYIIAYKRQGSLGLSFRRSNPQVPTFFEYLKAEGLVDKSIFSIYMRERNYGEFMFGGYDTKRAESEFQYAKWQEDEDPTFPGFSFQTKAIGYGNAVYAEKYAVVIDIEDPNITIPQWIIEKIEQEESSRGFDKVTETCSSIPFLKDIVIEFEDLTLRIPPAAYMRYKDKYTYGSSWCEKSLAKVDESQPRPTIILGTAFLKYFYTVFNHEDKTVGFSKMPSVAKRYPFEKGAKNPDEEENSRDYSGSEVYYDRQQTGEPYYLPLKVGGALAVLLIAKFCVILYFIIKARNRREASASEDLTSPKIEVAVNHGNQEDSEQESPTIDVGKITIEEEKFYA